MSAGRGRGMPAGGGMHNNYQRFNAMRGMPGGVATTKMEVYVSPLKVLRKDGIEMPKHPELQGGCVWVDGRAVGRAADEVELFKPSYKRHETSGADPVEAFGLEPLDVDFDACTVEELQEQVLKAVERDITPRQSLEVLRILTSVPNSKPTVACLNRVLITCKAHGSHVDAIKAFKAYGTDIAEPSTYKILADIAKFCKSLDTAYHTFTSTQERNITLDEKVIANLVSVVTDEAAYEKTRLTNTQKGYLLEGVLSLHKAKLSDKQVGIATSKLALLGNTTKALEIFAQCGENVKFTPEVYDALLDACKDDKITLLPVVFGHMQNSGFEPSPTRLLTCFFTLHSNLKYCDEARKLYKMAAPTGPDKLRYIAAYIAMECKAITAGIKGTPPIGELLKKWDEVVAMKSNLKEEVTPGLLKETLHALITAVLVSYSKTDVVEGLGKISYLCKQQLAHDACHIDTLKAVIDIVHSGKVTPATRGDVAESAFGAFIKEINNNNLNEWAFKSLCGGLEKRDPTVGKWSRHMNELLEKSVAVHEEDGNGDDDLDAEMALAAFLEADEQSQGGGVPSFFTPQLAAELMSNTDYLAVLDASACKEAFGTEGSYHRLATIVAKEQSVKCVITPQTLVTLYKEAPPALATLLAEYVKRPDPWLVPLPLTACYEVATNPYRSRPRKRRKLSAEQRSHEPAPGLGSELDTLIALCYRLQGTEHIGTKKTIFVSNVAQSRSTAVERKIVSLSVRELLFGHS
eukprot:TRINITY_DN21418_c0_g2_i1.p1 TRINITY_DN21418_c0_g2~~TRINITY_DN21418_c0_g2_i1.p1  ORF type:complete len:760 (+),score=184.50 TRINITY_DN21418_c0_g2_i1:45-2282(+)